LDGIIAKYILTAFTHSFDFILARADGNLVLLQRAMLAVGKRTMPYLSGGYYTRSSSHGKLGHIQLKNGLI